MRWSGVLPSHLDDTAIVRTDDVATTVMPRIDAGTATPGTLRALAPWLAFGLVAVLVVGGAVAWSASLRGPQPAAANLAQAPVPVPSIAPTSVPPAPAVQAPAPTARRAAPRSVPRATRIPVTSAPAAVALAPTVAAATTTTKPVAAPPADPFGPAFVAGCSGPAAASDPACPQAPPNPANPPAKGPATGR
jgi:hypothetical protein